MGDLVTTRDGWAPDGNAAVIEMTRANVKTAKQVIQVLAASLRTQAHMLTADSRDLSRDMRIIFRLEFIDADRYGAEGDDVWAADGVLIAAEATSVPRNAWNPVEGAFVRH